MEIKRSLRLPSRLSGLLVCLPVSFFFLFFVSPTLKAQDVILQGFYWNSHPGDLSNTTDGGILWDTVASVANQIGDVGFATIWTPPPSKGFAGKFDMGYGPYDYFDLGAFNSKGTTRTRHGNLAELQAMIAALHNNGVNVMADVVLNHRAGGDAQAFEEAGPDFRFLIFTPPSGRLPSGPEDFHPNNFHADEFGPFHDPIFFEDVCYFNVSSLGPPAAGDGSPGSWYQGTPNAMGKMGSELITWGRFLIEEIGFDELRLDAVKHIEPDYLAKFILETKADGQPFALGEFFDFDIGALENYHASVEGSSNSGGVVEPDMSLFDFPLRGALQSILNDGSGGQDLYLALGGAGLVWGSTLAGDDVVTWLDTHDTDRTGYIEDTQDCEIPFGGSCLKLETENDHNPIFQDKEDMGYPLLMAAEGRPLVFWKDFFWFGLDDDIQWLMNLRSAMAKGSSDHIQNMSGFWPTDAPYDGDNNGGNMFAMRRDGTTNGLSDGLVLGINDHPSKTNAVFVNTPFSDKYLKDYSDGFLFESSQAFGDGRALIKAKARDYSWYAPTGLYPKAAGTSSHFNMDATPGGCPHFLAIRAADAANLIVNGAPIAAGDEIAVKNAAGQVTGIGRIGQEFQWDGTHDMIVEILGAPSANGMADGEALRIFVYDASAGQELEAGQLTFAADGTDFDFSPKRPASPNRIGDLSISATGGGDFSCNGVSLLSSFSTDGCSIYAISVGQQAPCSDTDNSYEQEIIVYYVNAPAGEMLMVNGTSFAASGSPQTVVLSGLLADGAPVDITTSFTNSSCELTETSVFLAPPACISAISCMNSDASSPAYDDSWQSGDNDGDGFEPWILNSSGSNAGHFMSTSTSNGDGDSNSDGDIDSGGRAWGMFANSGGLSEAFRPFSAPLTVGATFSMQMDNGWIESGGSVGFDFRNADGYSLFKFYYNAGEPTYEYADPSGRNPIPGLFFTDEGLDISFTLTSSTSFEASITRKESNEIFNISGSLASPPAGDQQINQIRVYNSNAGFDGQRNAYFNNMEICAPPAISCNNSVASASAYNDAWQNGDNDGDGFGAWILSTNFGNAATAGHFISSSRTNGDGDSNDDGDIDSGGEAWGLYANTGDVSNAIRPFNTPLAVGQTFSIQMDNGWIDGGTVGLGLQNANGENLLEFYFRSGQANYKLNDSGGELDTGLPFSDEGLQLAFTLTSAGAYDFTATWLEDGAVFAYSGSLKSPAGGQAIAQIRVFNANSGFDPQRNAFFNNLEICTPPTNCSISNIASGDVQTPCEEATNTYTQQLLISFEDAPDIGKLVVNGQFFDIGASPQLVTLTDLDADGQAVDVEAYFSAFPNCQSAASALFTAPASCKLCEITSIVALAQSECDENTQTYTQQIQVSYENVAPGATLDVNGQQFDATGSPQTLTLVSLPADGLAVDLTASIVGESCSRMEAGLFTAPLPCPPCKITGLSAGAQSACLSLTNTYTQEVTVTYANPPSDGFLVVNGQNFPIAGSPQTVLLAGLFSNGAPVDVNAYFSAKDACNFEGTALFTAPSSCQIVFNSPESSSAENPAYDSWENGDNDGCGFEAWQLDFLGSSGNFVFTSTENGDGDSNGDGDIDAGGRSWGMFANNGGVSSAVRPFAEPLVPNTQLKFKFDNGWIDDDATVGWGIQNAGGENLLELFFIGGTPSYTLSDANGARSTGIDFTDEGLMISIAIRETGVYELTVMRLFDGATQSFSGPMLNTGGDQAPAQIRFFNAFAGGGSERNIYINSLEISRPFLSCPDTNPNYGCADVPDTAAERFADAGGALGSDCSQVSITDDFTNLRPCGGMQTVTFTISDNNSDVSQSCSQTISVQEAAPVNDPVDQVPDEVDCGYTLPLPGSTLTADNGLPPDDPCYRSVMMTLQAYEHPGACGSDEPIALVWEGVDNCGEALDYMEEVTILPADKAKFDDPPADVAVCEGDIPAKTALAYDNGLGAPCQISGMATMPEDVYSEPDPDGCYTITRIWSFTDECNRSIQAEQTIYVKPSPVIEEQVEIPTLCSVSKNPEGAEFSTGIEFSLDKEAAIDECNGSVSYKLLDIEGAENLIPGLSNAEPGDSGNENLISEDTWINPTAQVVEVQYQIEATTSYEAETGGTINCSSEMEVFSLFVLPKPSIEVELDIVGVTYPTSDECGHFNLIMDVEICNDGPVKVENLDLQLDLAKYSNDIFAGHGRIIGLVKEDGEVEDHSDLNDDFDGEDDIDLFEESTGSLHPGECMVVRVRVEVAPDQAPSVEAASAAEFRAKGFAKSDTYNGLRCYTDDDYAKDVLGDCWHKSRTAGVNDVINVTVDEECEAIVTPDMLLENHFGDCDTEEYPLGGFYRLRLLTPGELEPGYPKPYLELGGTRFDGEGCFIVYVENVGAFCEPLWGEVCLEDKTAPQFECEPEEIDFVYRTYQVQTARGVLSESQDGQINFSDYSCFKDEYGSPDDCAEPYKALEFYVSETDVYTFELWDPEPRGVENDEEMHLSLYQGEFNADEPCSNILAQSNIVYEYGIVDNDEAPDARLRVALPLIEGKKYTLIVATEDCGPDPRDEWIVYAFSDGSGDNKGRLLDGPESENGYEDLEDNFGEPSAHKVKKRLYCDDLDYILNSDEYTKNPKAEDNCDHDPETWFKDELHTGGDCAEVYIKRTWYVRDGSGNEGESCEQIIRFRRPDLGDVQKPPTTVPVECDELVAEILDENGHPIPGLSGYPFIITGFGIVDLNESYCNIGADYRDASVIDVCENTQKIVREWIILDWCEQEDQWELNNGIENNWRQILKVGDFSGPKLEDPGEKIYVSTDGFGCTGNLEIPEIGYEDNCSEGVHIVATLYKGNEVDAVDRYGQPTGETYVEYEKTGDFAPGESAGAMETGHIYKIVYRAEDNCGNKSEPVEMLVEALDDTEPVAICDDDLHISIGGEGIAKITAADLDEGSWDNCELTGVYVSRKLATEDLREAYLNQVYNLSFEDLVESGLGDKDNSSDAVIWVLDADGDGEWDDENSESPELFQVLRYKEEMWYTWWRDQVKFICEEMGERATIELLAVDAADNTNRCWLDVLIEDKVAPFCVAPDDVEINCTELPYDFDPEDDDDLLALFGEATVIDNCEDGIAWQTSQSVNWNCNAGTIVRSFEAQDAKGTISTNTCQQTIIVNPVHNYEIKFPKDAEADCSEPNPDTITTTEIACDLLSVNVTDERLEANGDACYKIKRTYKVINWCEYDGLSPAVVVSRDADCDNTTGEEDVYVLVRPDDGSTITYIDRDNDEENNPTTSPCGNGAEGHYDNSDLNVELASTGYWEYSQFIKVYDTTAPVIEVEGYKKFCSFDNVECAADIEYPFTVTDSCAGPNLIVEVFIDGEAVAVEGAYPDYSVSGRYTLGFYDIEIHAADGCGNSMIMSKEFRVVDCKPPSPICINGLAVELMPTEAGTDADGDGDEDAGAMSIWASDFQISGLEDCTGPVELSINRAGDTPNRAQKNIVLTCDDPDTVAVEIYAWDNADSPFAIQPDASVGGDNLDYCLTYIIVQDNMFDLCEPGSPAAVAGLIINEESETVENVQVNLSGGRSGAMSTTVDGHYTFNNLPSGEDYTVTPFKDDDYLNGVSTFDLVLITKHILGSKQMDDPYRLIAADVNNSRSISALDLIQLRKLILSVNTNFPNNTSWRFVSADYQFPDETNPWFENFPEVLNYNDLQTAISDGHFVAVKIGDVNGNAVANSLISEERNLKGVFYLNVEDREVTAGVEYRVDFTAKDLNVQGYQFTLRHEELELVAFEYGLAKAENFGVIEESLITSSWNGGGEDGRNLEDSFHLFTLVFRAKTGGRLSELLSLNSRYTRAEAYDAQDELLDVALNFEGEDRRNLEGSEGKDRRNLEDSFYLDQNRPNPFSDETIIGFHLPEAMEANIQIYDLTGKMLKLIRGDYAKGLNQIRLESGDLPSTGVFYYTLETDEFTATKKMILIGE